MLPSYNEGQPIVVLEAMTAGIPTVGTAVGGMEQLIDDPLTTPDGHTWGPCGYLVVPDYVVGMAPPPRFLKDWGRTLRGGPPEQDVEDAQRADGVEESGLA